MPRFESIIDQERPIRILTTLLHHGALPHALLFTGIEGVGREAVAVALARACNCLQKISGEKKDVQNDRGEGGHRKNNSISSVESCGTCKACRKIESGNHPDIIHIKPAGPIIKIAQVRALIHALAMKPYEARTRVVIIRDAQTMNPAAGNALLKMLEEPPERTILILIATQTMDLLPTIVSRCQHIRFNPISAIKLENMLISEQGLDREDAVAISAMANGSFSRAKAMISGNWINRRNWILEEMKLLPSRPVGHILALAERLARDKEAISDALEVIKFWLRDLIIAKYNPAKIIHQDIADDIKSVSQKMHMASLLSKLDLIHTTQNSMQANINARLALEVMLLKLARL